MRMIVIATDTVVVCISNKARLSESQVFVTVTKSFLYVTNKSARVHFVIRAVYIVHFPHFFTLAQSFNETNNTQSRRWNYLCPCFSSARLSPSLMPLEASGTRPGDDRVGWVTHASLHKVCGMWDKTSCTLKIFESTQAAVIIPSSTNRFLEFSRRFKNWNWKSIFTLMECKWQILLPVLNPRI